MVGEGTCRGGDQEDDGGGTVGGTEVQGVPELGDANGDGDPVHELAARMRKSDAAGKARGQLVFTRLNLLQEPVEVRNPSTLAK